MYRIKIDVNNLHGFNTGPGRVLRKEYHSESCRDSAYEEFKTAEEAQEARRFLGACWTKRDEIKDMFKGVAHGIALLKRVEDIEDGLEVEPLPKKKKSAKKKKPAKEKEPAKKKKGVKKRAKSHKSKP